jgi:branched-chain amino acid aminotransferase
MTVECHIVCTFVMKKLFIMKECLGNKYIHNGYLQPEEMFDNSLVYEGDSIYEVIRMIMGSPVFFNDHMERLAKSVKIQHKRQLANAATLRKDIISVIRADRKKEANLKIVFNYNNGSENYLVYFIEPIYPTQEQYRKGVKGIFFSAERKDPESKVINHRLRSSIYHKLIQESGYEALLVNENNFITEGSRSNIFFLKGEILVTAPDNLVLNGITRKHILEICHENQIKVELSCVKSEDIKEYNAVFMTGTSPMVLPFSCVDKYFYDVKSPLMERLRKLYILKAEQSIQQFRFE